MKGERKVYLKCKIAVVHMGKVGDLIYTMFPRRDDVHVNPHSDIRKTSSGGSSRRDPVVRFLGCHY